MRTKTMLTLLATASVLVGTVVSLTGAEEPGTTQSSETVSPFEFREEPFPSRRLAENLPQAGPFNAGDHRFLLTIYELVGGPGLDRDSLPSMLGSTPKAVLPSGEIRELLKSGKGISIDSDRLSRRSPFIDGRGASPLTRYSINIAGRTPEQAEQLGRALIAVHNHWWKENRREYLSRELEERKRKLPKAQTELEKAQERHQRDTAIFSRIRPIPEGTTAEMKVKQLLLEIDIAGIRTTIDVAQRMSKNLSEEKASPARRDKLEIIKMEAQIELAGLLAKQKQVSEIMRVITFQSAEKLTAAKSRREELVEEIRWLQNELDSGKFTPLRMTMRERYFGRLPGREGEARAGGTIVPIDWQAKKPKPSRSSSDVPR